MAYDKSKGMVGVATSYSDGSYNFKKIDKYIELSSYAVTPDIVQEKDSYRNANGVLKRPSVYPYTASKIEFNTAHSAESKMDDFMEILENATKVKDAISTQNKIRIRFYNPKTRKYKTAWAYYPDITFGVYTTSKGYPIYTPVRVAFITYGEKR